MAQVGENLPNKHKAWVQTPAPLEKKNGIILQIDIMYT
jgi:hypothetical protein